MFLNKDLYKMLKLDNIETAQTFAITSRTNITSDVNAVIEYIEEGTELENTASAVLTSAGYYTAVSATFSGLNEDSVYTFTVKEGSNELHKGEFFVSSQSVDAYTINENQYTKNTTTNDYIIFEQ
jgi:hypothetical protein